MFVFSHFHNFFMLFLCSFHNLFPVKHLLTLVMPANCSAAKQFPQFYKIRATRLSRHPVALSMNNLKLHCITSCSLLPFTIHLPSHWTVLLLFSLCCFVVFIVIDILCFVKCFLFIFLFNLNYLILLMSLCDISVWFF